ncbi:CBS domain-containing protein [Devosia sp. A449]
MFVEAILPAARERLVTISQDAPLLDAARLLGAGVDLLVVCGEAGRLAGVITKTDVVKQIGQCQGAGCMTLLRMAMTQNVLFCRAGDVLETLWADMNARGLKNIPMIGAADEPIGVLNARDMLQALLAESVNEEAMMRDYVMGVGYR